MPLHGRSGMKPLAVVAVCLLVGCVESDHDRIADRIIASNESLHELLFSGTNPCGSEMLAAEGADVGEVFTLAPCDAHVEELDTRRLALELVLWPSRDAHPDDTTVSTYDLVYLSGDVLFDHTHLMFTDYAFFTVSIDGGDGTDRHVTLDGNVTVDGADVEFSKESFGVR